MKSCVCIYIYIFSLLFVYIISRKYTYNVIYSYGVSANFKKLENFIYNFQIDSIKYYFYI